MGIAILLVLNLYDSMLLTFSATYKNVNAQRPPNITEKARRMIENHPAMQLEKDFYNFCVQRFRKQLNHLQERELILETI